VGLKNHYPSSGQRAQGNTRRDVKSVMGRLNEPAKYVARILLEVLGKKYAPMPVQKSCGHRHSETASFVENALALWDT